MPRPGASTRGSDTTSKHSNWPSVRARSSNRAPQVGADDVRSARAALDDYATWYAPTVLGGTLDQWAEVATAGQLEAWLEQHPHSVIALFSRFATAAAGLHRVGHGRQNLLSGGFLEPCKDRHGRAGEVAESICSPRWGLP
jgi:hypothetical protein